MSIYMINMINNMTKNSASSYWLYSAYCNMERSSFRISKGMVPVSPSGTSGRRPSIEDTGMTYNTCDFSCRSYTMVD